MIKFNPFTGNFDLVNPDNFSYQVIPAGFTATIPTYQQMFVLDEIEIYGTLNIDGELAVAS